MYIYTLSKEKGGTLSGEILGKEISSDMLVDAAIPFTGIKNPIVRTMVSEAAKNILQKPVGVSRKNVIDAKFRRLS